MSARLVFAVLAAALVGCGHVETHEIALRPPSAAATRDPDVYMEGRAPAQPFYEVALLQVVGFGGDANPEDVTAALVVRARAIGCDAVVRVRVDQGAARASGFGVCVRWSPTKPLAPPQPPPPVEAPPVPQPAPSSQPPAEL